MSRAKWKKTLIATICSVGMLTTGILPAIGPVAVQASGEKDVVYTRVSGSITDASGEGTEVNPYNRFEDAVSNVADGGTVYILDGNGAFLNTQDEYGTVPYVISKNVTIEAAPGVDMANLSVRAGGIVLGGDVTFRNIGLGFANKYHDSIFANGHTLVLDNVSRNSGTRLVDLFAGGLYQTDGSQLGVGSAADGRIILRGAGEFGNIYAGSMNGSYTGNASISIENKQSLEGTIYGSGAKEPELQDNNWFDMTEPPAPEADADSYPVDGNVDINLADISVRTIEGAGATGEVNVTLGTDYPSNIALNHISRLTAATGRIIPIELTAGTSGELDLEILAGAGIELTNVPGMTVRNFTGGGTLVLGKADTLTITGAVTGQTMFLVAGGLQDKSGTALAEHTYIKGNGNADNFTFTPAESQSGMQLEYLNDTGEWKTTAVDDDTVYADRFEFVNTQETLEYNAVNGAGAPPELSVNWTAAQTGSMAIFDMLMLQYEVQYNGKTYKADLAEQDGGTYNAQIPELHMELIGYEDMDTLGKATITLGKLLDHQDSMDAEGNPLPIEEGEYTITAIAPKADGSEIRSTTKITIVDSTAVRYSVRYLQQNADDDGYTEVKADAEDGKRGVAGESAVITEKNYAGFEETPVVKYTDSAHKDETGDELKVKEDSSLQVSVYYNRKTYQLSYKTSGIPQGTENVPKDPETQPKVRYEQTVKVADKLKLEGWTLGDWYSNDILLTGDTFKMPMKDVLIQAQWTKNEEPPVEDDKVKADIKYSATGEPVNVEINGTPVIPPEGASGTSYETQTTFQAEKDSKTVTLRMGVLFVYEFQDITVNGVDYSRYIPTTEEELLAAFRDQQTWVEFEVPRSADDKYEILTTTAQAGKVAVGNFLWTYDQDKKYIQDGNGNEVLNDDYIENGKMELLSVQYGGITYSGKELEDHLQKGTAFDWDEQGENGEAVLPTGAVVTVKLTPDYGYQLTSFGINGGAFGTEAEDSTFTFEIKGGNFHLGARFTKVENKVKSESEVVTGGSVKVSASVVNTGTVVMSVEDATVTDEQKKAFSQIGDTEYEVSNYLDLNMNQVLYKGTEDETDAWINPLGKTSELKKAAEVTLKLKEGLDDASVVLHEKHDGTYEVIQPEYDAAEQTLTFKTTGFSNYAIASVKKDNVKPGDKEDPDNKDDKNDQDNKGDQDHKDNTDNKDHKDNTDSKDQAKDTTTTTTTTTTSVNKVVTKTAKTGDEAQTWMLLVTLALSVGVVTVVCIRRKRSSSNS